MSLRFNRYSKAAWASSSRPYAQTHRERVCNWQLGWHSCTLLAPTPHCLQTSSLASLLPSHLPLTVVVSFHLPHSPAPLSPPVPYYSVSFPHLTHSSFSFPSLTQQSPSSHLAHSVSSPLPSPLTAPPLTPSVSPSPHLARLASPRSSHIPCTPPTRC